MATTDFDLESLVFLEQTFYDTGFADGYAHGRIHGLIEGRALGREKGFEMWEELGFYEGFAKCWKAILETRGGGNDRAVQHIRHLMDLINQFPRVNNNNPSSSSSSSSSSNNANDHQDISKLQRQIRSRYKAICSSLGIRPRLHVVSAGAEEEEEEQESVHDADAADDDMDPVTDEHQADLNHHHHHHHQKRGGGGAVVAPGSSIPVWKIDKKSGVKSAVTNMDLSF